jgi:putative flippase GtrA
VYRFLTELAGYGLASALGLLIDVSILHSLVERVGWHYLPASIVAFVAGASAVYFLSIRFVFRSRSSRHRAAEFTYFALLGVAGVLVNSAVLALAIDVFGIGLVAAKLLAAVCTFLTNFTLRRQLLFAPRGAP